MENPAIINLIDTPIFRIIYDGRCPNCAHIRTPGSSMLRYVMSRICSLTLARVFLVKYITNVAGQVVDKNNLRHKNCRHLSLFNIYIYTKSLRRRRKKYRSIRDADFMFLHWRLRSSSLNLISNPHRRIIDPWSKLILSPTSTCQAIDIPYTAN